MSNPNYCPDRELNPPQGDTCESCGSTIGGNTCSNCEEWDKIEAEAEKAEEERLVELAELEANERYIFHK